jgi:hypothetical protein
MAKTVATGRSRDQQDPQQPKRLLALPGDLWVDVCGDSFDEEEID